MDQIEGVGGKGLPWEGANLTAQHRRCLGIFKASVTTLLSRDPSKRPSMKQFCDSCDRVLAGNTTVQAPPPSPFPAPLPAQQATAQPNTSVFPPPASCINKLPSDRTFPSALATQGYVPPAAAAAPSAQRLVSPGEAYAIPVPEPRRQV